MKKFILPRPQKKEKEMEEEGVSKEKNTSWSSISDLFDTLPSVTEVCGEAGSGRSFFCLGCTLGKKSLWLQMHDIFPDRRATQMNMSLSEVTICKTRSAKRMLLALKNGEIEKCIGEKEIEVVVFNRMTDPYYSTHSTRLCVLLVYELKKLYIKYGVKSLVITDAVQKIRLVPFMVSVIRSPPWEYAVPGRVMLSRPFFSITSRAAVLEKPEEAWCEFELKMNRPGLLRWKEG